MQVAPADLPDDEHVRVVPIARLRIRLGLVLVETNFAHAGPGVADVAGGAPRIPVDRAAPFPDIRIAVLAKAENNVALLFAQKISHDLVGINCARIVRGRSGPE